MAETRQLRVLREEELILSQDFLFANHQIEPLFYPSSNPSWYAVHVRSNYEKRVATELAAKGIESYVPAVVEKRNWTDRKKLIEAPLFPGYVFTRFDDAPASRTAVLRTAGAVRILGFGDSLEAVPDTEIEYLQQLLQANVSILTHPLLREGAWVRIRRGPLKDLEGLLVRVKSEARLVLSVKLLSRSVSTEIDLGDVELVRGASPLQPVS